MPGDELDPSAHRDPGVRKVLKPGDARRSVTGLQRKTLPQGDGEKK
jgi:hypothetical protein